MPKVLTKTEETSLSANAQHGWTADSIMAATDPATAREPIPLDILVYHLTVDVSSNDLDSGSSLAFRGTNENGALTGGSGVSVSISAGETGTIQSTEGDTGTIFADLSSTPTGAVFYLNTSFSDSGNITITRLEASYHVLPIGDM